MFFSTPLHHAYYPNSYASVFHFRSKERFLHRKKPEIFKHRFLSPIHSPLWVHVCTVITKREVSTLEKAAIIISTSVCTAKHSCYRKTEILPRQKRGFYMPILPNLSVAISFYRLLNLLHPVWKSLSSSVFSS